jgi:hypothetical protein
MWPVGEVGTELLGQEVGERDGTALAGLGRPPRESAAASPIRNPVQPMKRTSIP